MKQAHRATALIKSTPKGYNIWIPNDAFETADKMPEEEPKPSSTEVKA